VSLYAPHAAPYALIKRSFAVGVVLSFEESQAERASIAPLVGVTAAGMERVNRVIVERTGSEVTLIPEVARYLIDSGGKRLRPMVTIASAEACGYRGEAHVKLAAGVEFMHTATLFHDDVVDESDTRRGKRSARLVWGNQESVLVGDFLLGQAFKLMVEVGSLEALDVLSTAAATIAEGEVMQLTTAKNTETTEDEYLDVIRAKTAVLFSAAAEVGAIVAKAERGVRAAYRSYGANLGIAFQLIDDALDYGGQSPTLGKDVGDDFREGKVTLPVVLAYRRGTSEDREFWTRTLVGGGIGEEDLGHAIALLDRTRALKDTVERARHYGAMARDALAPLPEEPCKAALLEAVAFCIARAH
jgi:octaprenyl-diphosphate synthase